MTFMDQINITYWAYVNRKVPVCNTYFRSLALELAHLRGEL